MDFKNETDDTTKFTDVFRTNESFERKATNFRRSLNQSIRKSFRKIRVNKTERKTEISKQLDKWSKLKIFIKTSKCEDSIKKAKKQFQVVDTLIQNQVQRNIQSYLRIMFQA